MTRPKTPARTLILAVAASSVLMGGCSKNEDAKKAVSMAGHEFSKLSIGDSTLSDQVSNKVYNEAANLTSQYASNEDSFGNAAAITVALSKLGLATISGGDASAAETNAMHQSRVIRGHLSEWIAMNAVAIATTNLDVSDEKKILRDLIDLRSADVEHYTKLMESLQMEIADFQAKIDDLDAKAASERNKGAEFELQMTSVTATQAAKLAERMREHSLRADGFELESVRLQGKVGQLLPGAKEVKLQVQMAKDQIDLLHLSINELDQRVRDAEQDSAQARAKAAEAAAKLSALVDTLEQYRQETANPANEAILSTLRQSLSSARNATKTTKVSGALAKSAAQEHLARALSRFARGHHEMAQLYQAIEASGLAGDWQSKGAAHQSRSQELFEESKQAFQNAASSLRATRLRGQIGEALESAAVRLDLLGGVEPEPEYTEEYDSEEHEGYDEYDEYSEDDYDSMDDQSDESDDSENDTIDDDG